MKKILMALAATGAIAAAAAPAAAQPWRGHDSYAGSQRTTGYVDGLEWKINNAVNERRLSRGEARELLTDLRQVQPLAWRVETGQASRWERQHLDRVVTRIEQAVTSYARNDRRFDRDGRDYGYGYGRGYRR